LQYQISGKPILVYFKLIVMKIKAIFSAMVLCFFAASVMAQKPIPAGYTKATINLANGTVLQGYIKEHLKKNVGC
jgi:hypothetical protein